MPRALALAVFLTLRAAAAQQTPQLSPQAAYDQAITPVDIIHRVTSNWSDTEIASLTAAVAQAKQSCADRASASYTGDDLIAYARLCDLGQDWHAVLTATRAYIDAPDPKPQLTQAYAYQIKAFLNLKSEKSALAAAMAMLDAVPYSPLTDEVTTTVIGYMQFAFTRDALDLLATRQPILLKLLSAPQALTTPGQPTMSIPLHTLFEHALAFAAMEQYNNQPRSAAGIVADIDSSLPAALPPNSDKAILIAAARRQYALLGTRFPNLPGALSLLAAKDTPPAQPKFGTATVFLLFPPWCAQCIRQAQQIVPSLVGSAILHGPDAPQIHIYALLADEPPPPSPAPVPKPAASTSHPAHPAPSAPDSPKSAADQLRKTPTLVVAPATLADFNANDFPFLIATDGNGIIRLLVPAAPENALIQNGPIDQLVEHILVTWPAKP